MLVNKEPFNMGVETGASATVMSDMILAQKLSNTELEKQNVKLKTMSGN